MLRTQLEAVENTNGYTWKWQDKAADMVYNCLVISARMIAMALFAAYFRDWFVVLLAVHFVIAIVLAYCMLVSNAVIWKHLSMPETLRYVCLMLAVAGMASIVVGFVLAVFAVFSVFQSGNTTKFISYILFWFIMLVENAVLIGVWYTHPATADLWYHDVALVYVLSAHILSLFVNTIHYKYNNYCGNSQRNMRDWYFYVSKRENILFPRNFKNARLLRKHSNQMGIAPGDEFTYFLRLNSRDALRVQTDFEGITYKVCPLRFAPEGMVREM